MNETTSDRPSPPPAAPRRPLWIRVTLWVVATIVMLSAAVFQRLTGPTYPERGTFTMQGEEWSYRLLTSAYTTSDARIAVPDPGPAVTGRLYDKRYPTDDPFTETALVRDAGELAGWIPAEAAAGKVEYYVELETPETVLRLPEGDDGTVVLRFKDTVPAWILLPHVLFMFVAMLIGVRAGLGALFDAGSVRRLAWITFAGLTIGGMILGPIVQKYAFGAFWTGFPLGYDLTDNKTLLMWLAWLGALVVVGRGERRERLRYGRWAVAAATVVMLVVYLIPHSLRGSELDYDAEGGGDRTAYGVHRASCVVHRASLFRRTSDI